MQEIAVYIIQMHVIVVFLELCKWESSFGTPSTYTLPSIYILSEMIVGTQIILISEADPFTIDNHYLFTSIMLLL